jgi:hypothetical protein
MFCFIIFSLAHSSFLMDKHNIEVLCCLGYSVPSKGVRQTSRKNMTLTQYQINLYYGFQPCAVIDQALPDGPCLVHSSDVKVKITSLRNYFHPDVSVACGEEHGQMLNNPVVVIEVLSPAQRSATVARNSNRTRSCHPCKSMC